MARKTKTNRPARGRFYVVRQFMDTPVKVEYLATRPIGVYSAKGPFRTRRGADYYLSNVDKLESESILTIERMAAMNAQGTTEAVGLR